MPTGAAVPVLIVLLLAAACFAVGTARGSWRVWLAGYALAVVALALAYGAVWNGQAAIRHPAAPAPAARELRQ